MLSRWSCLISVLGIIAITVGVFGESNVPEADINVDRTNDGLSTSSDTLQKEAETISIDGFSSDQLSKLREDHEGAEKLEFQAEVHRMMQLIVNSLYKNKEIFLRELISNASDALDKIRVLSLTDREALSSTNELSIRIKTNKEAGTLHIIDTGIGMSKQEMVDNLGTIAKSGTSEFIAQLSAVDKSADASNLIGQFGVGFYSAFLVSKKVMVVSKKDGHEQYIWESNAESFSIIKDPRGDTLKRGTEIILFLNEEAKDYLQPETIKQLIKKRSQFVNFPIYVWSSRVESVQEEKSDEGESSSSDAEASVEEEKKESKTIEKTIWDWNQVNEQKPIWKKKPANVTESEYTEFYKFLSGDKDDPLAKVHFTAEGDITFTGLVYVPKRASGSLFNVNAQFSDRIKLYVRQVFIADAGEDLTHKYLSFIFGLVDSEDLPLNVSREMLQQSQLIKVIKKKLVRKILHVLSKLPEEEYEKFWKEYSVHIKLGAIEDQSNRGKLTELLRFVTSKSEGKLVSLQDYISRMKKDQKSIYYLTGSSLADVKSSPFVERMIKKGYEVIYMIDSIDEFMVDSLTTYKEKSLQNVAKDGLDLGSEDLQRKVDQRKVFDPLLNWLKEDALKGKIEKAELSERLLESPSALVATKYGWSGNMERVMLAQTNQKGDDTTGNYYANLPKVMEINPRHPLVKELAERVRSDPNDADAKETAELLFYVATLRSGYSIKDTVDFAKKIEVVMRKNLAVDLSEEVEAEIEEAGPVDDVKTTDEDSDDASAPKDEVSKQDKTHSSSTEDINENGEDIEEVCKDCPPFRRLLQWTEEEEELDFPFENDDAEDDDENDGEDSDNEEIDDIEEQVSGTPAEEHEDEKEQDDDETDDIESEDDAMLDDTEVDEDYNLGARKLLAVKPSIPEKKKKQSKSVKPKTKVPNSEPAEVSKVSVKKPSPKSKISVLKKQINKQKALVNKLEKKVKATSELSLDAFKSIRESKPKPPTPTPKPMRVVGTPDDHDCDGIPDSIDEDIDNDGLLDRTQDSDWDGELNHIDDDDDNDGIPDIEDEDANGDGIPDCRSDTSDHQFVVRFKGKRRTIDSDMDGIPDDQDKDDDDDGIPDIMEDDDGNQIPDAFNLSLDDLKRLSGHELAKTLAAHGWFDHDCDGIPDDLDPDDDNDGFFDNKQDSDRDGILNQWDEDDDNDGIPDSEDPDSNGDGIPDCIIKDTDNDGIPDHIDTDDDNDGIPDLQDPDHLTFNYFKDSDGDGIPDILDKDDDNDGIPDHNDQDADGDGSNDLYQDLDMDGVPDSLDDDMDNDGVPDHLQDHDCDGIPDIIDPDDDNDGFFDNKQDSDKDGILNEWDDDDDNDGIPDKDDPDSNGDGIIDCQPKDSDGDGIPDHLDDDDDNDGIPDHQDPDSISFLLYKHKKHLEAIPDNETEMARDQANLMNVDLGDPDDKDCDGIPDHLDNDQDNDGKIDRTQDSDMDGMLNHVDEDDDNDGIPDHLDPDANGDGIPDCRRDSNLHYKLIKSPSGLIKKVLRMRNPTQEEQHMVFLVNEAKRKLIKAKEKMFSPPPRRPLQSTLMTTPAPITQNEEQNTENVGKNAKPKKKSKKLKANVHGSRKLSVVDDDLNLDPHQFDDKPLLEDEEDMMDLVTESHELDNPQENSKFKFFPGAMAVDAQAIKKATIKKAKIEAEMKKSKKEQNTSPPVKVPKKGLKEVPAEKQKPQNCKTGYCPAPVTNTADQVRRAGQSAKYQRMAETKVIVESEDEDEEDDDENAEADDQDDETDYLEDEDGDGIPDYLEGDSDGDGIPDYLEDEDGDGIPDYLEDEDGDGIPDYLDEDSSYNTDDDDDNDGILDYHEDEDGNQMLDILEGKDTDGDGIPDYLDDDDDNDGVPDSQDEDDDGDGIADVYEDENQNQVPDYLEMEDSDGDGIIDFLDTDDDNDNIPDYLDDDDDGDGILDVDEDENQDKIPDVLELSRKGLSKISIPKQSTTKVTQAIKIAEPDDDEDDDDDEEEDTDETDEDEGIESGASYVYEDDDEEEESDEEEPSALRANVNRVLRWIESIVGVENSNGS